MGGPVNEQAIEMAGRNSQGRNARNNEQAFTAGQDHGHGHSHTKNNQPEMNGKRQARREEQY